MLCSSKINNRPDKLLKNRLIKLAYSLVGLTVVIILLFLYPQYFLQLVFATLVLTTACLTLTIKTLSAAEHAMSYGGFANEIIKNDFKIKRIENARGEAVIQNAPAEEMFQKQTVLNFIEQNLNNSALNKNALQTLQTACNNLCPEKVTLSLSLRRQENRVFSDEEWFEVSVRPIFLKKSDIFNGPFSIKAIKKDTFLFWNLKNITAVKNMESIFQEEHRNLHDFLDYLPIGVYTIDRDRKIEYANHALAKFLGTGREELTGKCLNDYLAADSSIPEHHSRWHGPVYFKTPEANAAETLVFQERYKDRGMAKARGVVVTNIPTSHELKNNLSHAYDKISWLFNFAPVGIIFIGIDGEIKDCNPQACEFLNNNLDKSLLLNHSIFDYVTTEDAGAVRKEFAKIGTSRSATSRIDVHIKREDEEKIALTYISPMKKFYSDDIENSDGLVLYMIDATKQKSLEVQFAQAQKMQAVGQLAGGVAHDFNNLLTAMIGFCDLLLQKHSIGDSSFADIIQIKQNANCAAELVRQLLQFSRKQPLQPELINITDILINYTPLLKRTVGEQVELKFHHGENLDNIRVDKVQFLQVVLNLCVNAKDAMNKKGTLTISTQKETLLEPYHFGAETIESGSFIRMDVTDSGCGIPLENMSRIFEPFFSTKQNIVGSGTGLGLATVYGIVRQMEGFIKVKSTVNVGTTFSIYLPAYPAEQKNNAADTSLTRRILSDKRGRAVLTPAIPRPAAPNTDKIILGLNLSAAENLNQTPEDIEKTRILLVDDENSVRTFALRVLRKKGYEVIGCNSAENALETLEKDTNFQLLITDMIMPGQNGIELAKQVQEQIPDIKIILASGYSEDILKGEFTDIDNLSFIPKPFSLNDLTQKVYEVMKS